MANIKQNVLIIQLTKKQRKVIKAMYKYLTSEDKKY